MAQDRGSLGARALAVFSDALEVPSNERRVWIETRTRGDPALASAVLAMFEGDRQGSLIMPTGGSQMAAEIAPPPERIGPYRIMDRIGAGGMGAVYRGERDDGAFDQTVAIKIIRPGVLVGDLVDRFVLERQIQAGLQHANIARLYDGGALPDGAPYMIMEYVDGSPILDHAASNALTQQQRLALFRDVVGAVAYAHQNLIVHRDLTPNNVLVTHDGQVKLIDFGISRPESQEMVTTAEVHLSHTPGYAAPERTKGHVATTLVDIYSLGILLDEICPAPRSRDIAAIAARAGATAPEDRYPSATALLDDVQRALSGRALAARRAEPFYPFRSFVRRHPLAVGSGVVAAVALAAGFVVTAGLYQRAEQAREIEQARFNDVRSISSFMMNELYDRIGELPHSTPARGRLAEEAQFYLDRLAASRGNAENDLELTLSLVDGYRRLAEVRGSPSIANLGDRDAARAAFAEARKIAATLDRTDLNARLADDQTPAPRTTEIAFVFGRLDGAESVFDFYGNYDAAQARKHIDEARAELAVAARGGDAMGGVWATLMLAEKVELMAKTEPAAASLPGLVTTLESELAAIKLDDPALPEAEKASVRGLAALIPKARADVKYATNDKTGALKEIDSAIQRFSALVDAYPENRNFLKNLSLILVWRAGLLLETNDRQKAAQDYDRAADVTARFIALDPADDEITEMKTYVLGSRAFFRALLLKDSSALTELEQLTALKHTRALKDPASRMKLVNYVMSLRPLGDAYWNQDRVADACRNYALAKSEFVALAAGVPLSARDEKGEFAIVEDSLSYCKPGQK